MATTTEPRINRNATLILACFAQFMVILDVSVVNVALPTIRRVLSFSEADLQWVVNAYTVTFAGFLLLGGRATDLLGRRRVFVWGLTVFALTSLVGGLADSQAVLIAARAAQGLGAAVIAPASLSILTTTFTKPAERNRAIGIWGAMGGAGGAAGVLLGGALVSLLSWRWILFINVPIGLIVAFLAQRMIAEGRNPAATRNFDLAGAFSATLGLSLLVLGIVRTGVTGWGSTATLAVIASGVALLLIFVLIEGRFAKAPLVPLRLFRSRSLSAANVIVLVVGGSTFGMWFFFSLYLQDILHYSALKTGITFLPMTLMIVVVSTITSRVTLRIGAKRLLIAGMLCLSAGLMLFTQLSTQGGYVSEMLLPSLLTSTGLSLAFIPATICATSGVAHQEAGLASAVVNTCRLFGGALGLAILAAIATARTSSLLQHPASAGVSPDQALLSGFHLAFFVAGTFALFGALVAIFAVPAVGKRVAAQATQPVTSAIEG